MSTTLHLNPEISSAAPELLPTANMDHLQLLLREAGRASGPSKRTDIEWIKGGDVAVEMSTESLEWAGAPNTVQSIVQQYNKIANRSGVAVNPSVAKEIAKRLDTVLPMAEYPTKQTEITGLQKLVAWRSVEYIEYFLSEDFVIELQDIAVGDSEMELAVGNRFSIAELLRRAQLNTDPQNAVREAVSAASDIHKDVKKYLSGQLEPALIDKLAPI